MLPGFRFLFATIVLAVSVLIFGLGAAALLRASHEEFASLPSWRPTQAPSFALRTESAPTLAMLRVETPAPAAITQNVTRPVMETAAAPVATAVTSDRTPAKQAEPSADALESQDKITQASAPDEALVVAEPSSGRMSEPEATPAPLTVVPLPHARPANIKLPQVALLPTEASEPQTPQAVTPQVRSTEATAAETLARPTARRTRRASAQAIARRRLAIARARAAKAGQQQQQTQQFPLFGG